MPFFSVIIPLYNKEKHIIQTLNSVLSQSFTNYEVIIVNDGSTDNSLSLTEQTIDNRIRVFNQENKGVSEARNFAMQQATGNYFAFLDADDIWKGNHLENLYQLIIKHPNCGLYCANYIFNYGNYTVNTKFSTLPKQQNWKGIVADFFAASMSYRIALTSAVAIPAKTISDIGFFDTNFTSGQDTDYWTRIALRKSVAFSKEVSVIYNAIATNRISNITASDRKFMTFEKFAAEEKNNLSLKKFNDMYRAELAIKHKLIGDSTTFLYYKKSITNTNLSFRNKILLTLPSSILKTLWRLKQFIKANFYKLKSH